MTYKQGPTLPAELAANERICAEFGNVSIGELRNIYGAEFGRGFEDAARLVLALPTLDASSLDEINVDLGTGSLAHKLKDESA